MEVLVSILGGLNVNIRFEPDDVADYEIVGINNNYKNCDWLIKRLSRKDEEKIHEACQNALEDDVRNGYFDSY